MKKAIITGATGMIGISLINYLLSQDVEIIAIIRPSSGRVECLPKNNKLKIIECDMENFETLEIKEDEYDVFYHLAWMGTTGESRNDICMQNKNIEYTINAIKLAGRIGCKRFLGAGSQAEYGRVEGNISPETQVNPETAYGIAKLCAGKMGNLLAEQLNIEFIWTRILSIYGPYDNAGTMVMSSIINMLEGKVQEYTKAEQMWDYLYVEDVAKALYLIAEKGEKNKIYCIGSGKVHPLYEYIYQIRNAINPKLELNIGAKPYSRKQVMYLCANIEELEKIGFKPEVEFKEGINKTIEWYKTSK